MRLSEAISRSGFFWMPGDSADALPGNLQISESGEATLELLGLPIEKLGLADEAETIGRIVGVLENGKPITLDECFFTNRKIVSGGPTKATIHVTFAFIGAQYDKEENVTFSKFRFSVEGLDEWVSISGFSVEHEWDTRSTTIQFNPPKDVSFELPGGITLSLTFGWTAPGGPSLTELKISQKAYFSLAFESPRPIRDIIDTAYTINNFLCFASDNTVAIDSAQGYTSEHQMELNSGRKYDVPIETYYRSIPSSSTKPKNLSHGMLFKCPNLTEDIKNILTNWITAYESYGPAFDLYFSARSGNQKYLSGRFLALTQAIETLHRRNSDETVMSEAEFGEICVAIIQACTEDKREWLKVRMTYANELPLRERIRQVIDPFGPYFGAKPKRKAFIGKVVDTRNYLTHYDEKLSDRAAKGEELWNLCKTLEGLFQLHLLQIVGFDEVQIGNLVKGNQNLRRWLDIQ